MIAKIYAEIFKIMIFYLMFFSMICAYRDLNDYDQDRVEKIILVVIIIFSFVAQFAILAS